MAKKSKSMLDEPRVRFNWGYHDARTDRKNGRLRTLVESGAQDLKHVSKTWDLYYYQGYSAGGDSPEKDILSNNAWKVFSNV